MLADVMAERKVAECQLPLGMTLSFLFVIKRITDCHDHLLAVLYHIVTTHGKSVCDHQRERKARRRQVGGLMMASANGHVMIPAMDVADNYVPSTHF